MKPTPTPPASTAKLYNPLSDLEQLLQRYQERIASLERRVSELEAQRQPQQTETLLDASQAATQLGMTPRAVRQAAYRGSIPSIKVGRRVRIKASDLAKITRKTA